MPHNISASAVAKGFKRVRLGDIVSRRAEAGLAGLPTASVTMNHGLVARNPSERRVMTTLSPSQHLLARKGDIAYNMMRMWQGACGLAHEDCLISPAYVVLRPREGVCPAFVYQLFKSPEMIAQFHRFSRGLTDDRLRLYFGEFQQIEATIPADYSVQESIATALEVADRAITSVDRSIRKMRLGNTGLMRDVLTYGIDNRDRLRDHFGQPGLFTDSTYGLIPSEWELVPVEKVGEVRLGRQRSPLQHTGKHTTPYLRVANVFDGWIDYSDVLSMDFTPAEKLIYGLKRGDILLNEGQSVELVGRSAIYQGDVPGLCFQNTLVRFRCYGANVPGYCQAVFKYWLDTGRFAMISKQTTSVAHLGGDRFAKMLFPRPCPEEQSRIDSILSIARSRLAREEQYRDKLRVQRAGLSRALLTGEARV